MKLFTRLLSVVLVIASAFLCQRIVSHSLSNQRHKADYAELHHVKYGLFSVDAWKRQLTVLLTAEIDKLDLTGANEEDLRQHLEVLLNTLIDKADKSIREENSHSAKGRIKQSFMNMFVSMEGIKKGIPEYATAVIHEIKESDTRAQVKDLLKKQLEQYSDRTFDTQDTSHVSRILIETGSEDIGSARIKVNKAIAATQNLISRESIVLILLSIILFGLSGFSKQPLAPSRYILLALSLIILLIAGVATPMIDLEARISQVTFVLMGHPIHFENQVLYFQSKSILDVFWILIAAQDIPMKAVGVLVITFSIVFPLLKMASSFGYYYDYHHARTNPVIRFFVLKSGKWCMADVMVVAMFMAYIGFNGIIDSQFDQLRSARQELVILTTNGTSLQPGYYLFLTYTLLALCLSGFLTRESEADDARTRVSP